MKIGYIKEWNKQEELLTEKQLQFPIWLQKILIQIKRTLGISNIIVLEDSVIAIVPVEVGNKISKKQIKKSLKQMKKQEKIQEVVVSKSIAKNQEILKMIQESNIHILDGTWLWDYMITDGIQYICTKKQIPMEKQEISIAVKQNTEINIQNIMEIAKQVKFVNIITPHIEKFKTLEEYLYTTYGIVLRITNTKKSTGKSSVIVNLDFTEEEMNSYKIPERAVILNKKEEIKIKSKKFTGINSSFFKVKWNEKNISELKEYTIYHPFEECALYESRVYRKDSYKNIREQIKKDEVEIVRFNRKKWTDR